MADETQDTVETTTTPEGETPQGTDNAPSAEELTELRKALKAANAEAAARRIKLQEYEEAEQRRKEAEMSELEKLQAKYNREREAREAAERAAKQTTIRHAVELQASGMGFHNPADALAFMNGDTLSINDEGKVEGVEDALKELSEARPYLVKSEEPKAPPRDLDGKRTGGNNGRPDRAATASKYGIQVYDD